MIDDARRVVEPAFAPRLIVSRLLAAWAARLLTLFSTLSAFFAGSAIPPASEVHR